MLQAIKIKSLIIFFIVCFSCLGLAYADTFSEFKGQINTRNINVRLDATVSAEVVCTLNKADAVEVVGQVYDWYKIRLPKNAPAYIKENLLECNNVDADFAATLDKCLSAKVIKDRVNIRLKPTESAGILGKIDKGTVVNVIAKEKDWFKILPVYQSYGWVNKKFVDKEIVELAKQAILLKAAGRPNFSDSLIVEGRISPYGIVLWRKATHKLITSENKIYFLKGNRKSLDSLNYRKVKVIGKLISPTASKYPIIQIDIIEALN